MSDSNPPPHLAAHADRYREDPRRAALDWFREAGSGLFMHYGPSALHGKGDWGMYNRAIPVAEYEQLAERFTAEDFDADFITDLACEAEARYVNLTTKHHDGFLLWDSANESYNVANSAARRDLVGELAEQCRRKGLGFFCY